MRTETAANKPEILAPVGGSEQLLAAVRCGADAVYFGLRNFNARRNADNFGGDDVADTIAYCHERGVRVHITVNTLVKDSELAEAQKTVDAAAMAGADALIIQDLAVASYAKERWPEIEMHASTQMAVHNALGVKLLKKYGFDRFVLARELSIDEVKSIIDETGEDVEVFVHGAHCMSLSGNCYLSSMIGGRSGNRGLCAQPCRLECSACESGAFSGTAEKRAESLLREPNDHALSLKDLSYIEHINDLALAGVRSLKIEGRMKRAEYVAAAVTACRDALEGRTPDMETLRSVFSRSGFTDGYYTGLRNRDMFGYRTKDDVVAAESVLKDLAKLYEKEPRIIPVDMELSVFSGIPCSLTVSDGIHTVSVPGDVPQAARTLPISEEYVRRSLSKTGGTPYYLDKLQLKAGDGLMVPASALNDLRRRALEELGALRAKKC